MRFPTMWHFDMCRFRRAYAVALYAKKLQMMFGQKLNNQRIFKRLAKALIRLRVCAGWSEPLLVAHTKLLEILCCGSICLHNWVGIAFYNACRVTKCSPTQYAPSRSILCTLRTQYAPLEHFVYPAYTICYQRSILCRVGTYVISVVVRGYTICAS